ncbi:MAG: pseudouridine synthase [Chitinophagaceae bacterium]|nr:pseudouridine synthase [Chitinophagaceae bacterium]
MSNKENSKSFFEKTFGKEEKPKSEKYSEEKFDKKPFGDKRKSGAEGRFESRDRSDAPRKSFDRKDGDAPRRRFDDKEGRPFERKDRSDAPRKSYDRKDGDAPRRRFDDKEGRPFERKDRSDAPRKSFDRKDGDAPRRRFDDKNERPFDRDKKPFPKKEVPNRRPNFDENEFGDEPKAKRDEDNQTVITRDNQVHNEKIGAHLKPKKQKFEEEDYDDEEIEIVEKAPEKMPLNKYIAHCGLCSRRDAIEHVKQGKVRVNGELAMEPGMKINEGDVVSVGGKKILPTKNLTYILLNKPKGFITTTEDEKGRRTIMDLVASADVARLYPIGRLDRNTTGLIILTNDGELAQKLSHPKYNVKKIYQVTLDKNLSKADFEQILAGVTLEDGPAPVDSLAMLEEKNEIGIEIHSGKNRIVRRIFEHLGYQVEKLDRVMYAGLTKKNVPRGKWRLLTSREVILLKHFKA